MNNMSLFYLNEDIMGFQPPLPEMSWEPHLTELLGGLKTAMLTTLSEDGELRGRPMKTIEIGEDGSLCFLASTHSERTHDVDINSHVNVTYLDPSSGKFVSIVGFASLIKDPEKISELWRSEFKDWFPEGPEDPSLRILKVQATRAELWSQDEHLLLEPRAQ